MATRRQSGSIRKLPSGRWQARVRDPATKELIALGTFSSKADAHHALTLAEASQARGGWVDPRRSKLVLESDGRVWMLSRPSPLAPRTVELDDGLLRNHILPEFGSAEIGQLTTAAVRRWHAGLTSVTGASTAAKARERAPRNS